MSQNIDGKEALNLFEKFKELESENNSEGITKLYDQIKSQGLEFDIKSTEEVKFEDDDGNQYTEVTQTNKLILGGLLSNQ